MVDKGEKAMKLNSKMFGVSDRKGRRFALSALSDRVSFFDALQPGRPVTGQLVFDVPEDAAAPKLLLQVGNGKIALIELDSAHGNSMAELASAPGVEASSDAVVPADSNATGAQAPGAVGKKGTPGVSQPLAVAMAGPFNVAVTDCQRRQSYRNAFYEWVTSAYGAYLLVNIAVQNMDTSLRV